MNLFVTDYDPIEAAKHLDNKRLGKALIEGCQLLSTAVIKTLEDQVDKEEIGPGKLSRISHVNHPVSLWVRSSVGPFRWTYAYSVSLDQEYKLRFDKPHESGYRLDTIVNYYNVMVDALEIKKLEFCNCAKHQGYGIDFTELPVTEAYRQYLNYRWKNTDKTKPTWTNRAPPEWYDG
jgi:hypothetical protein